MATGAQLVLDALELASVVDIAEEVPGSMTYRALQRLNAIIDQWSSIGVYIPNYNQLTINVLANVNSYAQSFVIQEVLEGNLIDSNNTKTILFIDDLKEFNTWNASIVVDRPTDIFIQTLDNATPQISTVFFYPTPNQSYTATLYTKNRLTELNYSSAITAIPSFYFRALVYELANELSNIYKTVMGERFNTTYDRILVELKATAIKDMSVLNRNPFIGSRYFRPRNFYAG